MKLQILFSDKNKKNISKYHLLKFSTQDAFFTQHAQCYEYHDICIKRSVS